MVTIIFLFNKFGVACVDGEIFGRFSHFLQLIRMVCHFQMTLRTLLIPETQNWIKMWPSASQSQFSASKYSPIVLAIGAAEEASTLFLAHHTPLLLLIRVDRLIAFVVRLGDFFVAFHFGIVQLFQHRLMFRSGPFQRRLQLTVFVQYNLIRFLQHRRFQLLGFQFLRYRSVQCFQCVKRGLPFLALFRQFIQVVGQSCIAVWMGKYN